MKNAELPSDDNRDLFRSKNPATDYGGTFELPKSVIEIVPVLNDSPVIEQASLFDEVEIGQSNVAKPDFEAMRSKLGADAAKNAKHAQNASARAVSKALHKRLNRQ